MNIYKNTKDGKLYNLYIVSPRAYTGRWLEAKPYNCGDAPSIKVKENQKKDFILVGSR